VSINIKGRKLDISSHKYKTNPGHLVYIMFLDNKQKSSSKLVSAVHRRVEKKREGGGCRRLLHALGNRCGFDDPLQS